MNISFVVLCALMIAPFVLLVSISFSNEQDIMYNGYKIIPQHFDLTAYKYVFKNPTSIINAYKVTGFFSVVATILNVFWTSVMAYPLAFGTMPGKRQMSLYIYFTLLFSGGMVPSYIMITQWFHLGDSIWVYIIPAMLSNWYIFMIRTFFKNIPYEIYESAVIDGASEYRIYATMIVPLSKPVLATIALFVFLANWNNWNTSMLFINKSELFSLQYLLQKIMNDITMLQQAEGSGNMLVKVQDIPSETVRMAMAVVVAGPALVVFPFFQKYFVKGLTVGSVMG